MTRLFASRMCTRLLNLLLFKIFTDSNLNILIHDCSVEVVPYHGVNVEVLGLSAPTHARSRGSTPWKKVQSAFGL